MFMYQVIINNAFNNFSIFSFMHKINSNWKIEILYTLKPLQLYLETNNNNKKYILWLVEKVHPRLTDIFSSWNTDIEAKLSVMMSAYITLLQATSSQTFVLQYFNILVYVPQFFFQYTFKMCTPLKIKNNSH